ncbi:MAG: hypothetical protein A3F72_20730 [Bacteroidetes bacterium RIFCSPLOWO2_12_FULL_35_15]|nr:MAG: hypothetical protein A3F72_20730 [Bacteroidetes bacterium RIFCSPLOWO2_12_FULL_35_15]
MTITQRVQQILSRLGVTKFFLILFASISIVQISCNKASEVGLNVQPSTDLLYVNYIDTTLLITRTVKEDSLRTDQNQLLAGYGLLGKYIDPVFGTSNSSIYTQVKLPTSISATSFGISPICDSIVLSLIYDAPCYGKKIRKIQTVNVYELLNGITAGTSYYSTDAMLNTGVDLANAYSFTPRPTDSVLVSGVKSKPQLRIPLNVAFGQNLLNNQSTGNLVNNATFQNFMKGFYITTENTTGLATNEGNIMRFLMGASSMTIYYHYTGKTIITSVKPINLQVDSTWYTNYVFSLGSVSRHQNFSHDYSTVSNIDLSSQLSSGPPSQNSTVYIQSMAGLKTKVEMPTLMDWVKNGAVAINKAVLTIKIDTSQATYLVDTFTRPTSLIPFGINDDGTSYVLPDYLSTPGWVDGNYNSTTHEYNLIISKYIQQILAGTRKNNGFYITIPHITAATTPSRVIIGGGASGNPYQMKLNISYTKLH